MNQIDIFRLVNKTSVLGYKIVGVSYSLQKFIFFSKSHIDIADFNQEYFDYIQEDYRIINTKISFDYQPIYNLMYKNFGGDICAVTCYIKKTNLVNSIVIVNGKFKEYSEIHYELNRGKLLVNHKFKKVLYYGNDLNQYEFLELSILFLKLWNDFIPLYNLR